MSQDHAAPSGVIAPADDAVDAPAFPLITRLAAEAFGTFILVLGIIGTAAFGAVNGGQILPVALAGGLMLIAGYAAVGHVSGGHFNPAVTLGTALTGRTSWTDVLPYWVAQFVGAILAGLVTWAVIPKAYPALVQLHSRGALMASTANGWGSHSPLSRLTTGQADFSLVAALLVEIIIAAVFVGIFLAVTSRTSKVPAPAVIIGLTLGALHIFSWPITNAGFNPARSLASLVFAGSAANWGQYWLFFVAPLVGAVLAALCYRAFAPAAPVAVVAYEVDEYDVVDEDYGIVEEEPAAAEAPVAEAPAAAAPAEEAAAPEAEKPEAGAEGKPSND